MALIETIGAPSDRGVRISTATPGDYFALLKPRVMALVVFTAACGLLVAPGAINPFVGLVAILAIAVGAGASGALNMWYDADIDARMKRTASRPIPAGRVAPGEALAFGLVLSVGSVAFLGLATNWAAAALLAFTIFFYAVIYTMWLKRSTVENIVIGGAAGSFPPMIGWMAVTGGISVESITLFMIIFLWTPPHFWALGLLKADEYRSVGVPMLPSVAGPVVTARRILIYSLLLAPTPIVLSLTGFTTWAFAAVAVGLGVILAWRAVPIVRSGGTDRKAAGKLFGFSILYLFLVFAALVVDRGLTELGVFG